MINKLSVIIPCHNSGKTIQATLMSILSQTVRCDEIIVIDDGSQDNTRTIVDQFMERVRYIYQDNSGVSAARNRGVDAATSDWIAFCDADDIWHPHKLEIVRKCIAESDQPGFIFHDFYTFDSNNIIEEAATHSKNTIFPIIIEHEITMSKILNSHTQIALQLSGCPWQSIDIFQGEAFPWLILGNFILPSSVVMRRENFLKEKGFDTSFRSAEESEFFLRFSKSNNLTYIDLPLAGYRISPNSLSKNIETLLKNAMRALIKNCVEDPITYRKYKRLIKHAIGRRHCRISYYYLSILRREDSFKAAIAALKYDPLQKKAWFYLISSLLSKGILKSVRKYKARKKRS